MQSRGRQSLSGLFVEAERIDGTAVHHFRFILDIGTVLLNERHEELVAFVRDIIEERALVVCHVAHRVADVLHLAALEGECLDADFLCEFLVVRDLQDRADRARERLSVGKNLVGNDGDHITARAADVSNRRDNRDVPRLFDAVNGTREFFRRTGCAAWRVQAEQDAVEAFVFILEV